VKLLGSPVGHCGTPRNLAAGSKTSSPWSSGSGAFNVREHAKNATRSFMVLGWPTWRVSGAPRALARGSKGRGLAAMCSAPLRRSRFIRCVINSRICSCSGCCIACGYRLVLDHERQRGAKFSGGCCQLPLRGKHRPPAAVALEELAAASTTTHIEISPFHDCGVFAPLQPQIVHGLPREGVAGRVLVPSQQSRLRLQCL
jgi:hypothetical protein